jgi:hypothetical protein
VAPGAYDGLSAKLIEQAGFDVVYATGGGISRGCGYPDIGLLTMTKVLMHLRWIVEATNTWWSNYGQLRRSTDRRARHRHAALRLATAVLIIGDFTGLVGDPSGRTETRPMLDPARLVRNARTYLEQVGKVLDMGHTEIRRNSEWLAPLSFADVAGVARSLTVAQLMDRDDFQSRYREGRPISLVEFLYPLMQGYDSVAVRADVEMGGTDQTFNLMVGRDLQRAHGQEPQGYARRHDGKGRRGQDQMDEKVLEIAAAIDRVHP